MTSIFILGCGATKQDVPCAARYLYTGPLFQAALKYALAMAQEPCIRILSAKWGLVNLDATLAPYDVTWGSSGAIGCGELARQMPVSYAAREFVLLCGFEYRAAFGSDYGQRFHKSMKSEQSLAHLGIGQQIKWLKENTP